MTNPRKLRARVVSITPHGPGTYSVRLVPEGAAPRHSPGQFLHLTVDEYDPAGGFWPESRVFSIASAAGAPYIDIVYSVKGRYTGLMEERLLPGAEVWLKLPYGHFVIDSALGPGQDAVLVAGGTGVSPFLPYLEKLRAAGAKERRVLLHYGVRENRRLVGGELIGSCASLGLVEARVFVEEEEPDGTLPAGAKGERGRLDAERALADAAGLRDPVFFLSGPPAMIRAFGERLGVAGIGPGRIRTDEWE